MDSCLLTGSSGFLGKYLNEALKNHFESLKMREEANDKNGISISYANIGLVYIEEKNSVC